MTNRPSRHRHASVAYAYLCSGKVDAPFLDSLLVMTAYDAAHQNYLAPEQGGGRIHVQTSPRIAEARSQVVDHFVKTKAQGGLYADADWLLFLDSDATFDPDLIEQLMNVADAAKYPVVGALAFGGSSPDSMFPTLYRLFRHDETGRLDVDKVYNYPRDAMCEVGATGSHCILIHKSVFQLMYKAFEYMPDGVTKNPYPWYAEGHVDSNGTPIGEDIIFCFRANAIGCPVFVHTGIRTGHVKTIVLDEEVWDDRVRRRGLPQSRVPLILPGVEEAKKELVLP